MRYFLGPTLGTLVIAAFSGCLEGVEADGTVAFCIQAEPSTQFQAVYLVISKVEIHEAGPDDGDTTPTTGTNATAANTTPAANTTSPAANTTSTTYAGMQGFTTTPANTTATTAATTFTFDVNGTLPRETNATAPPGACDESQRVTETTGTTATTGNVANTTSPNTTAPNGTATTGPAGFATHNLADLDVGGWTTVASVPITVNLLAAQAPDLAFIGQRTDVEPGRYTQIRLTVERAWLINASGEQADVEVPSGKIKLIHAWTVESDRTTELIALFDVDQSLHRTGEGRWMLRPVFQLFVDGLASPEKAAEEDSGRAAGDRDESPY